MRQTVLRPLGLITQPNEHGQYPEGALSVAHNVHLRDPGIVRVQQRPGVYRTNAAAASHLFRRMWAAGASLLTASDDGAGNYQLRWVSDSFSSLIAVADASFSYAVGKIQAFQSRGRYYVTTESGVLSLAAEGAATATLAGFCAPQVLEIQTITSSPAAAIAINKTVAWRAVFVRKGANGEYLKIGPPSYAVQADHDAPTAFLDFTLRVRWPASVSSTLQAGDQVELYRTVQQDIGTDVGDDYYLSKVVTLTSGDLLSHQVDILDSTREADLGAALYTNDEEGGASSAKFPPSYAIDACNFKGHTFYVAPKLAGYLDVRVPSVWGMLDTQYERTYGIGVREVTCDITSGNAVLTNVDDTTGIVAGQRIDDLFAGARVPFGTAVVSKTANTITMSANALSSHTGVQARVIDIIEVNATLQFAHHPYNFMAGLGTAVNPVATFNQPLHVDWSISTDDYAFQNMAGVQMRIAQPWYRYGVPTLRATNGQNYSPALPLLSQTAASGTQDARGNRLLISELDQPEAVASGEGNELLIGSGDLLRVISTTDALWAFCTDGLYRISGEYPTWRVDPVDPLLVLASRNSVAVLHGNVWAYTERGLVVIGPSGAVQQVSSGLIGDTLPGAAFAETWDRSVVCDETNREVHVIETADEDTLAHVWNVTNSAWVTLDYFRSSDTYSTAHAYAPYLREMVWGSVQAASAADVIRTTTGDLPMLGAEFHFQPLTGDGDPFTLKNWIDCTYILEVESTGYVALPAFNGQFFSGYPAAAAFLGAGKTTRAIAAVPTELNGEPCALGATIAPGLAVESDGDSEIWGFKGLSLRWVLASDESNARAS